MYHLLQSHSCGCFPWNVLQSIKKWPVSWKIISEASLEVAGYKDWFCLLSYYFQGPLTASINMWENINNKKFGVGPFSHNMRAGASPGTLVFTFNAYWYFFFIFCYCWIVSCFKRKQGCPVWGIAPLFNIVYLWKAAYIVPFTDIQQQAEW